MDAFHLFIYRSDELVQFDIDLQSPTDAPTSRFVLDEQLTQLKLMWARVEEAHDSCLSQGLLQPGTSDEGQTPAAIANKYRKLRHIYIRVLGDLLEQSRQVETVERSAPPPPAAPQNVRTLDTAQDANLEPQTETDPLPFCTSLPRAENRRPTIAFDVTRDWSFSNHEEPDLAASTPSVFGNVRVPPCDVDTFNGDYLAWPSFRDLFTSIYIHNTSLTPVQKLWYLVKRTTGEANDIVRRTPMTNAGFQIAWQELTARYEHRRALITNQLQILYHAPAVVQETATAVRKLQGVYNNGIATLRLHIRDIANWDAFLLFLCTMRLPEATRVAWEQSIGHLTDVPPWSAFDAFLTTRCRALEALTVGYPAIPPPAAETRRLPTKRVQALHGASIGPREDAPSPSSCRMCPAQFHALRNCVPFLQKLPHQREELVRQWGICSNCFSYTHDIQNCTHKMNCRHCNRRHHSLLHYHDRVNHPSRQAQSGLTLGDSPTNTATLQANQEVQSESSPSHIVTCFAKDDDNVLIGTALVTVWHQGVSYEVRALIDPGSQATLISERIVQLLHLPISRVQATVSGLNEIVSARITKQTQLTLGSRFNPSYRVVSKAWVMPRLASHLPNAPLDQAILQDLPEREWADPKFYESARIDLLIGGNLLPLILRDGVQRDLCGTLLAQETVFGWILTGPAPIGKRTAPIAVFFNAIELDRTMTRFWEVEDLPQKSILSETDRYCEELYNSTTQRDADGRYIVALPFRQGFPGELAIGKSRTIAQARFIKNEARLLRTPALKQEYDAVVTEYLTLNHMQVVQSPIRDTEAYYLPHHAVIKPESTTTKVRVVFNASCPTSNGNSLNDVLYPGPTLQTDLTLLLLRWRLFRYVFNSDIQKMYRQIRVIAAHTPYQRILFRDTTNNALQDYELQTVTFGVNCAPYLAIRTLLRLADDVESQYPLASKILRNDMYVDDVLSGGHSTGDAVQARDELRLALRSAGLELRKWTSNSKSLLAGIPEDHLLNSHFVQLDDHSAAKTLGVRWKAAADAFFFQFQAPESTSALTKREVLSEIAKLFDPAGWLAPAVVTAKIFMQRLWLAKLDWDDLLPPALNAEWSQFHASLSQLQSISIPRWVRYVPECDMQVHVVCDASERAYAAAVYLRVTSHDCEVYVSLLCAKTRVAPVKTLSIPRLELCGAVLAAELAASLVPQLPITMQQVYFWSDSTIVLSWLNKPACVWQTFVANRVSLITQLCKAAQWCHVDSESNPADLASRGAPPPDLAATKLWWHGPPWLTEPTSAWPHADHLAFETTLEQKPLQIFFTYFDDFEDSLERISSLARALRVLSYVFRWLMPVSRSSGRTTRGLRPTGEPSSREIDQTRIRLLIVSQQAYFPTEYRALRDNKTLSTRSSILTINPFIDPNGLMRGSSRLAAAPSLTYDERHPIIVSYHSKFARLLVDFIHRITLHGGSQLMLRLIRCQYWVPKIKNLIRATVHQCKQCTLFRKQECRQLMGQLPPERTVLSRPFTHTGLDFAGPFDLKVAAGRSIRTSKGYVCVFVCFSTKAIHLEVTSSLTTEAFMAAFQRFVSRRGCPLCLYSDNGRTFVGAAKEMKLNLERYLTSASQALSAQFPHPGIEWKFIPPGAPHMGGLWEAGVKSFKMHMKKVNPIQPLTYEEFATVLNRVEACLNSRPLCPQSTDPDDLTALTPGHFLVGSPLLAPAEASPSELSLRGRWRHAQALYQTLCARWRREYLHELHRRTKWKQPHQNLAVGDLVVIRDDNLPPTEWRLGRVQDAISGPDSLVRVLNIRTARGVIRRPITKVVLLPAALPSTPTQ